MVKPIFKILFISSLLVSTPLAAGDSLPNKSDLLNSIATMLSDRYVFPAIGARYRSRLQQCIEQDCLQGVKDEQALANAITKLLLAVHEDRHLKVFAPGHDEEARTKRLRSGTETNASGIANIDLLENRIGYIKINTFPGTSASVSAIYRALKKLKDAEALIFDIRDHRGGSPRDISEIGSFLFQQETHLVTTHSPYRNNGQPVFHRVDPNEYAVYYKDKPVYLLTSKRTASAAEHFAMAMKATGRAILVGDVTRGAGHWGERLFLEGGFSIFVPSGRTYHPVNKLGWEGIGVTPDILIDEVESLEFTLQRIRSLL